MIRGICRLHGREDDLRDSHIIPKWMYRRATRSGPLKNSEMVYLYEDVATTRGKQLSEYLLCSTCEARFGVWEKYVAEKVARQENDTIPALAVIDPSNKTADGALRVVDASRLDVFNIIKFVTSIFWRSSVSSEVPNLTLGQKYNEKFRSFLHGRSPFPKDARLFFQLLLGDEELPVDRVITVPEVIHGNDCDEFIFAGGGMLMGLSIGNGSRTKYDGLCLVRSKQMVVGPTSPAWRDKVLRDVHKPVPVGKLAKEP